VATYSDKSKVGDESSDGSSESKYQQMPLGSEFVIALCREQREGRKGGKRRINDKGKVTWKRGK
jgi:hypothetical protein